MTFLSRLYSYRESALRNPTEDFLTEAFAEWLRLAAGAGLMRRVLRELLGFCSGDCLPKGDDGRNVVWTTQHVIGPGYRGSGKRPDIVGQSEDFFLIIENKIDAGIAQYVDEDGVTSQLELYADYQRRQRKRYGGLVLLTHYTSPPDDWPNPVVTWSTVHRWMSKLSTLDWERPSGPTAVLKYWTRHFTAYLEETGMDGTRIALSDIIAMPAFERLRDGMRKLGSLAHRELTECAGGSTWRYCSVPHGVTSGEFNEPQFFGVLMTKNRAKADDADLILWAGVLATTTYEVVPHIAGIPELSVGFGVWTDRPLDDSEGIAAAATIKEQLGEQTPNMEWNCEWKPSTSYDPEVGAVIVHARLSLVELHHQAAGDFWDEPARSFFTTACNAVIHLPEETWSKVDQLIEDGDTSQS